jgi:hypothetical protein
MSREQQHLSLGFNCVVNSDFMIAATIFFISAEEEKEKLQLQTLFHVR